MITNRSDSIFSLILTTVLAALPVGTACAAPGVPVVADDGGYTTSRTTLNIYWTISDPASEVADVQYRIMKSSHDGEVVRPWTSAGLVNGVTVSELNLVPGASYYFNVRARYGGNFTDQGNSDGIISDSIDPVIRAVIHRTAYTSNDTTLTARWFANDVGTGIAEYRYAVGTMPGQADVKPWESAGTSTEVTASGMSLLDGHRYYFSVEGVDYAGNSSTASSRSITVDATAPVVTNIDDGGDFSGNSRVLSASWGVEDAGAGLAAMAVSVGTTPGAVNVKPWTPVGLQQAVTLTDLSMAQGVTYHVNIRATDLVGNTSVTSSDGITVDVTPPVVIVADEGDVTTNPNLLEVAWQATDSLSGISEYRYAVGTGSDSQSERPWTSVGLDTSATVTGLALTEGANFRVSVMAIDEAGNTGVGTSDGILVDLTAPVLNAVYDSGNFTSTTDELAAGWVASDIGGIGIAEYRFAVGTAPGLADTVPWTSAGLDTEVTVDGLSLQNGTTYYFAVEVLDAIGRSTVGYSDGIMVDTGNPIVTAVVDAGDYTGDPFSLGFSYAAQDDESGVREYFYAIGTAGDVESEIPWTSAGLATSQVVTGLNLAEGVPYVISVYASDMPGNVGYGSSGTITVDVTPPEILFFGDQGNATALQDSLSASWNVTDALSGMSEYRFAIGTSPGTSDIAGWTSAGLQTSVDVDGLSLQTQATYYFTLDAIDVVGNTTRAFTDGIVLDTTAPAISNIHVDAITVNAATVKWTTSKPTSGVVDYGQTPAHGIQSTNSQLTQNHALILSALASNTTYHFQITARDDAGSETSSTGLTFTTLNQAQILHQMGTPGESYIDPEILQSGNKMTFRSLNGEVWVADLDPATGEFLNQSGKDYLMDTESELSESFNGPEFGVDANGWAVFYSKEFAGTNQVWRATLDEQNVARQDMLTNTDRHQTPIPTQDPQLLETRVMHIIGSSSSDGDIGWMREDDPDSVEAIVPVRGDLTNRDQVRWVEGDRRLLIIDPASGQITKFDTDTGETKAMTGDAGFKTSPKGWYSPEFDGELTLAAVLDNSAIGIYRDLGGEFFDRIRTLSIPPESNNSVISSLEIAVVGDKSYISMLIKDLSTNQGDHSDGEVWLFDLNNDADTRTAIRCDSGQPNVRRTDPEVFVGESELFIYYNVSDDDSLYETWLCRTGILVDQPEPPRVLTDLGEVEGVLSNGAEAYKGIPYAEPPTGSRRFSPPDPVTAPWSSTYQATSLPHNCPQPDPDFPQSRVTGSEDCLHLNVWTPSHRQSGELRPVLFFLHGGANRTGSTSVPLSFFLDIESQYPSYDGSSLSSRGDMVVVTANYRLGVLGNLAHDQLDAQSQSGTSGNYGLLDVIEALKWVQNNISAFGGDPDQLTVIGQSAGAYNVGSLLVSPLAQGLFSKAIMHSGVISVDTAAEAYQDGASFVEDVGLSGATGLVDQLRFLSLEEIVLAPSSVPLGIGSFTFEPHVDGYVLPNEPLAVIRDGAHNAVQLMIGSNEREYAHQFSGMTLKEYYDAAQSLVPADMVDQLHALYPVEDFSDPTEAYVAMLTDRNLTSSARSVARAVHLHQSEPVYRYYFRKSLSTMSRRGDGAYHGSELLFLFQHMNGKQFSADDDDRAVEELVLSYWSSFVRNGDPNNSQSPIWPAYNYDADPFMVIDTAPFADSQLLQQKSDFWSQISSPE